MVNEVQQNTTILESCTSKQARLLSARDRMASLACLKEAAFRNLFLGALRV